MGRSDPIIFNFYRSVLPVKNYRSIACLGNQHDNSFTASVTAPRRKFFDLALHNWNINDDHWGISEKYDLVISTRCPYFSKDPRQLIEKCHAITNPGGLIFLDWGLGDHWRFDDYKVGWIKNGQHEFAYSDDNFLWSSVWHDSFVTHPEFIKYQRWVSKFGYSDVKKAVFEEVPSILNLADSIFEPFKVTCAMKALWEESPQLYIVTVLEVIK